MHDQGRGRVVGACVWTPGAAWSGVLRPARCAAHEGLDIEDTFAQDHVNALTPLCDGDSLEAALAHDEVTQLEAELGLSSLVELEHPVGRQRASLHAKVPLR